MSYIRLCLLEHTFKRNRNDTLFQWKIHGVLFKVIDGGIEFSRNANGLNKTVFEMITN